METYVCPTNLVFKDADELTPNRQAVLTRATPDAPVDPVNIPLAPLQNQRKDSNAPIDLLPPEILARIMHEEIREDRKFVKRLETLRLVSRAWSDVIISTPILWASIDVKLSIPMVLRALERSKNAPLRIRCRGANVSGSRTTTFMATMFPYATRCEALELGGARMGL